MQIFIGYVLVVLTCPAAGVGGECVMDPFTDDVHPTLRECLEAKKAAQVFFLPNSGETMECADVERPVERE